MCNNCSCKMRMFYIFHPDGLTDRVPLKPHRTSRRKKEQVDDVIISLDACDDKKIRLLQTFFLFYADIILPVTAQRSILTTFGCYSLHLCHHEFDVRNQLFCHQLCHDWFDLECHACATDEERELLSSWFFFVKLNGLIMTNERLKSFINNFQKRSQSHQIRCLDEGRSRILSDECRSSVKLSLLTISQFCPS